MKLFGRGPRGRQDAVGGAELEASLGVALRGHYRGMRPPASEVLMLQVARALDAETGIERAGAHRSSGGRIAVGAGVAGLAVVAVAIAVVAGPLFFGVGPEPAGPSESPSTSPTASPSEAQGTSSPTVLIMPTLEPSAARAAAQVHGMGRISGGGVWWVQGDMLWWSEDPQSSSGMSPWPASNTQPASVYFLASPPSVVPPSIYAWSLTVGPDSANPYGGQGPSDDHLQLVVSRAPGVGSWSSAVVPGDYPDSMCSLSFVDAELGYLMCSGSGHVAPSTTILSTDDGGASWKVVATPRAFSGNNNLGGMFAASDGSTLWAGAQAEAGGHGHPLLAVSRDGGRTWSEVALPGMTGEYGGTQAVVVQPPVFLDDATGFVEISGTDGTKVFATSDGGRTWDARTVPASTGPVFFVDAEHWVVPAGSSIAVTTDGGRSWETVPGIGLEPGHLVQVAFVDASNGFAVLAPDSDPSARLMYRTLFGAENWTAVQP
jgi:photosystem II stability/assembly factor-like uncharacterized protein